MWSACASMRSARASSFFANASISVSATWAAPTMPSETPLEKTGSMKHAESPVHVQRAPCCFLLWKLQLASTFGLRTCRPLAVTRERNGEAAIVSSSHSGGADADLVVYDPNYRGKISVKTQHMNLDYSAFEGWRIEGRPSVVTVRGQVAVRDGKFVGKLGHGKFLQRKPSHF